MGLESPSGILPQEGAQRFVFLAPPVVLLLFIPGLWWLQTHFFPAPWEDQTIGTEP